MVSRKMITSLHGDLRMNWSLDVLTHHQRLPFIYKIGKRDLTLYMCVWEKITNVLRTFVNEPF